MLSSGEWSAAERSTNGTRLVADCDVLDSRVGAEPENDHAHNERHHVERTQHDVPWRPLALLDEHEPHDGREVECEARQEDGSADGQQGREEGNGLGNDKGDDCDGGIDTNPGDPAHGGVDVADNRVLEPLAMDVTGADNRVDAARDVDDGQGDTKGNLGHGGASREESRGLDIVTNKGEHEGAGDGVEEDLEDAEREDGAGIVGWSVHLVHEAELAKRVAVCEHNVGDRNEALVQRQALLGVGRPADSSQTAVSVGRLDAGRDDSDTDGTNDGDEIDVSENGHFGEGGRDGQEEQENARDDGKDDSAGAIVGQVPKHDSSRQNVGGGGEGELQDEHERHDNVPPLAKHHSAGVGVVGDVGVLDLDLTDDITAVHGQKTHADRNDDAENHAQ